MKRSILIILLALSIGVYAQNNTGVLKGVITDSLSNPIPFVSIVLEGTEFKQTMSDELGNFKFSKLAEGKYQITFSCMGYEHKNHYCSEKR